MKNNKKIILIFCLVVVLVLAFLYKTYFLRKPTSVFNPNDTLVTPIDPKSPIIPKDPIVYTYSPKTAQTGIYVANDWDLPVAQYVLDNPDISGVRLRYSWEKLQPSQNTYDFSILNSDIQKISQSGKAVSIAIATGPKGARGPIWLFDSLPSSGKISLIDGSHQGIGNPTRTPRDFGVPWDQAYKSNVKNLITALKNNLESLPEYNNISQISTFGLSQKTDEMRIPDQDLSSDPLVPPGPDDFTRAITKWNSLPIPFRPSVAKATFQDLLDTMMTAFPTKTIGASFIGQKDGFPLVNDQGVTVAKKDMPDIASEMVVYGKNTYGKRFSAMTASLTDTGGTTPITTTYNQSISTGYQLNNSKFGSPTCLTDGTTCDDTKLRAAFTKAKTAKAYFVEIFPETLKAYPNAVKDFKGEFK